MNIKNVKKRELKNVSMTIRTTKSKSKWMKEFGVSPSMVFDEAIKELIEKQKEAMKGK